MVTAETNSKKKILNISFTESENIQFFVFYMKNPVVLITNQQTMVSCDKAVNDMRREI